MVQNRIASTTIADNILHDDGVLEVRIKSGSEISLETLKEHYEATIDLCEGRKVLTLIDARTEFTTTDEAREYNARMAAKFRIAEAVLIDSLAVRLVSNFYISFNKPGVPTKVFTSREEAVVWLKGLRD